MAVMVFDVVNDADARMVQLRSGASLAHEAVERLAVVGQVVRNKLQRDMAAEHCIFRFVNHAHATTAELPHNVVVGNCLADHSEGRGFHLAVMLGRSKKSGQLDLLVRWMSATFPELVSAGGSRNMGAIQAARL